jgi:hypothetical protein
MANPEKFGPINPEEAARTQSAGDALMRHLPMANQGYVLRNTISTLLNLYANNN